MTIRVDGTIEHVTLMQTEKFLRMSVEDGDDTAEAEAALAAGALSPKMVEELCDSLKKKDWRAYACAWESGFTVRLSGVTDWGEEVVETKEGAKRIFTYRYTVMVPEVDDDDILVRSGFYDGTQRIVMPGTIRSATRGTITPPDTVIIPIEDLQGWREVVIVSELPADASDKNKVAPPKQEIPVDEEVDESAERDSSFSDVPARHPHADAIAFVRSEGIVGGYPDGTFRPDHLINRAELVKMLIASYYAGVQGPGPEECLQDPMIFSDVSREWFASYVCVAKSMGIIGGYPDGSFRPGQQISFVEAAKIMVNFLRVDAREQPLTPGDPVWYEPFVRYLEERSSIPQTITTFNHTMTRGEVAEILYRLMTAQRKPSQAYDALQ